MSDRPLAISVSGVSKDFRLATEQRQTLKERVINPRFDRDAKVFHALSDINFDVHRGEFFGIVGRNGSGKSTLLKCMAGIYKLDQGKISIGGRLSTFIELGVGFNPDLAARDNIILNGIMLGLSPNDAAARVDEVVEFAELQDHTDLKLKNYSSGMQVRLAFSVMTQIEADVLLIDEVLAVGDASFQAKCFDVFRQLREAGKTIVLVTHDMATVSRFCDRAMLVEDGVLVDIGNPERIGDRYLSLNFERNDPQADLEALAEGNKAQLVDPGAPYVTATRALLVDADSQVVPSLRTSERGMVAVDVQATRDGALPMVTIEIRDELDNIVFGAATSAFDLPEESTGTIAAGDVWRLGVWFQALLTAGQYRVRALVHDGATGNLLQRTEDLLQFDVTSVEPVRGLVNLPHDVSWGPIELIEEEPIPPLLPVGAASTRRHATSVG